MQKGKIGETYNIGTGVEKTVEEITTFILDILDKPESLKKYVPDRLQHDKRYLLDSSKLLALGWKETIKFENGLKKTIEWYKNNSNWWRKLK